MRRLLFTLLAITLLLPAAAFADTKIGYVDLQRALNEVAEGQAAKARLKSNYEKTEAEIKKQEQALRTKQEELAKKRLAMDEATLRQKATELEQEIMKAREATQKMQRSALEEEQKATRAIFDKMQKLVSEIAQKEGFTYVLEKTESGVIYGPQSLDLTNDLIRKYDATYKVSSSKK